MFRNFLRSAWRNLLKNKTNTFINIAGLTIGMSVALLIGLWIWNELSFDHYHERYKRIAQAMDVQTFNGNVTTSEAIAIPLADAIRTRYRNDFKHIALAFPNYTHSLAVGDRQVSASGTWTDPELPEMLTFKMISGQRNALKDPSTALISQSLATALFSKEDATNKTITLDNSVGLKVGGVFEDLPENTTFHNTTIFLPWNKALTVLPWLRENNTAWDTRFWKLFVELNEGVDLAKASANIRDIAKPFTKVSNEEIFLHPMSKWRLYNEFREGKAYGGRLNLVWLFAIIGVFILILACINFMNLTTARSSIRAKEVGIRKAIGATRWQLMAQFFGEAILISLIAFVIAIGVAQLSLQFFNELSHKQVSIPYPNPVFWGLILLASLVTGLFAGSYPSFYLSAFHPIKVLKGGFAAGTSSALPRKILLVIQFTVSIVLMIGTIIVYLQIQYVRDRPTGYQRDGLLTINMNTPELNGAPYNRLRDELIQTGVVTDIAESSFTTTENIRLDNDYSWKGKDPNLTALMGTVGATHDYGRTVGWQLMEGRDFSRNYPSDSTTIIINEATARLIGMQHPIGESIRIGGREHTILGVVKDMITQSPYTHPNPTIFYVTYKENNILLIKLRPTGSLHDAIARIEPVLKRFNPGVFDYQFADEEYARKFDNEVQIGKLAMVFTILAIFISCLGLFGLASFTAEQRRKEIGVRKVLGASVFNLWGMLLKDFVVLIILSLLIASPVVYLFMHNWLQNYEYRTTISWWIFLITGIGTLAITVATVSYQSIKAATANPKESLKDQ
jgi:putative ABC transport system permease protein